MNARIRFSLFVIVAGIATTGFTAPTTKVGTPLSDAILDFNKRALSDDIGKHERPISEAEVIASILYAKRAADAPYSVEFFEQFKAIAETKTLPSNATFESLNGVDSGENHVFDIWSVRINLERPDRSSYSFVIRQRIVGSRPLDQELARLDGYIKAENVESWVGGYRILERRTALVARIEKNASK